MKRKLRGTIVFLDAGSVNWGDVSFKEIESLDKLRVFDWTAPEKIYTRLRGADSVITNKCRLDGSLLKRLPKLKAVHLTATGVNNIDVVPAKALGIAVTNVTDYCSDSVAQWTMMFVLALAGNLTRYDQAARDGRWSSSKHFAFGPYPIQEIKGKTLGIVGYGSIGRRAAQMAQAFSMKILIAKIPGRKYSLKEAAGRVALTRLLQTSDFVSLHAPLSGLTRNLINARNLRKMKKSAYLMNLARGGIVNEKDLRAALEKKWIAGAATDVLSVEPPPRNHVLMGAPNLMITPHVAWASPEVRQRVIHEVALNIKAFQNGKKRNRVV